MKKIRVITRNWMSLGAVLALLGWNLNAAWASEPSSMQVSTTGVGPLNAQTKVTLSNLKTLLPGRRIVHEKTGSEGIESAEDFKVFNGDTLTMEVITDELGSDKLGRVTVHDPKIKTSTGLHVNSGVDELLKQEANPNCFEGSEEYQEQVICKLRNPGNVTVVFPDSHKDEFVTANRTMRVTKADGRKISEIWWMVPTKS